MRCPWQRCAIGGTGRSRVIWYFSVCNTRLICNKEQWRVLDQAHLKRNLAEYEGDVDVDEKLVEALMRVTREVAKRVKEMAIS